MKKSERKELLEVYKKLELVTAQLKKQTDSNKRLTHVKFVGITFEPDSYKRGEAELNDAISHGYNIITDYPTGSGVVISLGLYKTGGI